MALKYNFELMKPFWQQIVCWVLLTQTVLFRIINNQENQKLFLNSIPNNQRARGLLAIDSKPVSNGHRPSNQTVVVGRKLSKLEKRLKFVQMVKRILTQSKSKGLKIESIKLGEHIKKVFGIKNITSYLTKLVGTADLNAKIKNLKAKIQHLKQANSTRRRKLQLQKSRNDSNGRKLLTEKKEFAPGFAGMPFPPFMMNGPHFHPPMNITINSIPNPVARGQMNPFELEQLNLSKQIEQMARLKDGLDDLESTVSVVSAKVKLNLNDKYSRLEQIND
jgi:hypothetical protein